MEVLDLYDDNGNKLDEEIIRGNKPELGKNIMLSVIYIKNNEGKYIIQKTSKEKGNKYSTTGGHVIKGENALTTIIRELKEELGLNINKERGRYMKVNTKVFGEIEIADEKIIEMDNGIIGE